ncbi:MAG: phosphotransferase [Devosia sp.]|uniref:phosphotransferase n=1 Tax=Devosia sp. TaxID=1871048 RepID=UPI001A5546AE|nr:phosphotransferase [Devosia sp.]MBL8599176.1 phosphotransferase [Devosia sp.]
MTAIDHIRDDVAALPLWDGRPVFEALPGGISNLSFVATDRSGKYAVRLTRDFPFHNVYRAREVAVARAAHAAGFAPEVVYAEPGLMISRFLDARPLKPEDVRRDIARIVELLLRFHREMQAPIGDYAFDVFAVNRGYMDALGSTEWTTLNERLEAMQGSLAPVFAHHDLLAGNILDDGTRLWLIDFEYSGSGSPMFDLANLSSNAGFSATERDMLLRTYFGSGGDFMRAHRAMEAASLLREALWSLVSARHINERDVDYVAYAEVNFARLRDVLRDLPEAITP